jgi:hypothetical protein
LISKKISDFLLYQAVYEKFEYLGGNSGNTPFRVRVAGSEVDLIFKELSDEEHINRELTAYDLSAYLGFNHVLFIVKVPTGLPFAHSDRSRSGVLMLKAPGKGVPYDRSGFDTRSDQHNSLMLFDYICRNYDRHCGNFCEDDSGNCWAFDHDCIFHTYYFGKERDYLTVNRKHVKLSDAQKGRIKANFDQVDFDRVKNVVLGRLCCSARNEIMRRLREIVEFVQGQTARGRFELAVFEAALEMESFQWNLTGDRETIVVDGSRNVESPGRIGWNPDAQAVAIKRNHIHTLLFDAHAVEVVYGAPYSDRGDLTFYVKIWKGPNDGHDLCCINGVRGTGGYEHPGSVTASIDQSVVRNVVGDRIRDEYNKDFAFGLEIHNVDGSGRSADIYRVILFR